MHANFSQKGFTLIELMIAITLGLIVSAAALMIFLSSQRLLAAQNGLGEIGQNTIFGLNNLTRDLRHINLDTSTAYVSTTQNGSGIIFNTGQTSVALAAGDVTAANVGASTIMNTSNDQLTIQYKTRNATTDCEGTNVPADTLVVQKYYVGALPNAQQPNGSVAAAGTNARYGLYCDAAWNGGTAIGAGQTVVIPDAESFKVSLGTRDLNGTPTNRNDDKLRYQTLAGYIASPTGTTVVSVEVGVVMRSSSSVHADSSINKARVFNIAGQNVQLADTTGTATHLRVPVNQVVAIRNSQGIE